MLAWVDIETTGLDPKTDQILEVGLIVTTDDLSDVKAEVAVLVKPHKPLVMVPAVAAMHAKSGLLEEVHTKGWDIQVAQDHLRAVFAPFVPTKANDKLRLCGYNPQFDRSFLYEHMPRFLLDFHYRSIDVASFTWAERSWAKDDHQEPSSSIDIPETKHRALLDLYQTIGKAKTIMPIFQAWGHGMLKAAG